MSSLVHFLGQLLNVPLFGLILVMGAILTSFFLVSKSSWLRLWIAFGILQGVVWTLKFAVGRPRPAGDHHLLSPSFPSGVAADAGFAAMFLSSLWPKYWYIWHTLGIGIASLRLSVGAHYPSDLVAGYLIGWLTLVVACKLWPQKTDTPMFSFSLRKP